MKSRSIWKPRVPSGIDEVVRPRAVTYSATCQKGFSHGERARRILPMIWVQSCSVSQVSRHAALGSSGQGAGEVPLMLDLHVAGVMATTDTRKYHVSQTLMPASRIGAFRAAPPSARRAIQASAPPAPRDRPDW